MAESHDAYHIADNNDIYEPARNNTFEFQVTGLGLDDRILRAGVPVAVANDSDYIKNAEGVLRVAVEASSVPHFELGTIEVRRGNDRVKFADVPTFSSGTLVVKDYISKNSGYSNPKDILMAWQALAYDVRSGKINRASTYKKKCSLIEYSPDWEVVRTWVIEGCWVSAVSEDNFSSESNGNRTFTATIVYDRAYPTYPSAQ